jgi:hypothetical protein
MSTSAAAVAAAHAAAVAQAIKASGVLVQVEPHEFSKLLAMNEDPLVVYAPPAGLFSKRHRYLMSYGGLAFYAASLEPIDLGSAATVVAKSIHIPT